MILPVKPYRTRSTGLFLIAIFKLVKGLLLVAVGIGALKLLHRDLAEVVAHGVAVLRVDPDNRFIHRLLAWIWAVDDRKLKELSAGTFFYAGLLLTEGTGLWLGKRWAEYFTIMATGIFIPLEAYELLMHVSAAKIAVIAINVAVVWYLAARLLSDRRRHSPF